MGFRTHYLTLFGHVDLESRIRVGQENRHMCTSVTLDIAKAYDSVEHFT